MIEAVEHYHEPAERPIESLTIDDFLDMVEDQEIGLAHQQQLAVDGLLQGIDDTGSRLVLYGHTVSAIQKDIAYYQQQVGEVRTAVTQLNGGYSTVVAGLQAVRVDIQSHLAAVDCLAVTTKEAVGEAASLRQELEGLSADITRLEAEQVTWVEKEQQPQSDAEKVYLTGFFETHGQWPSDLKAAELTGMRGRFQQVRERLQEIEQEVLPGAATQKQAAMAAIEGIVTERWQALTMQIKSLRDDGQKIESSLAMAEMRVLARMQTRLQELGRLVTRHVIETDLPVPTMKQGGDDA